MAQKPASAVLQASSVSLHVVVQASVSATQGPELAGRQVPEPLQVSTPLQNAPSEHTVPVADAVPTHPPATLHTSPDVHAFPSLHPVPAARCG
jgi:hypothetical protein